jgi:hypothetical protein
MLPCMLQLAGPTCVDIRVAVPFLKGAVTASLKSWRWVQPGSLFVDRLPVVVHVCLYGMLLCLGYV